MRATAVLSIYSDIFEPDHRTLIVKLNSAEGTRRLSFSDTRSGHKDKRPMGRFGSCNPARHGVQR